MEAVAILFGLCLIAILILGIYLMVLGIRERELPFILFGIFLILMVVLPFSYYTYDTEQKTECTQKIEEVSATVSDKQHKSSYVQIIPTGKTTTIITHPEEWDIMITYQDLTQKIDNKNIYDALNVKDKVIVNKITWIKKNGTIYKVELQIKKN